jgi:hypothetical protein
MVYEATALRPWMGGDGAIEVEPRTHHFSTIPLDSAAVPH